MTLPSRSDLAAAVATVAGAVIVTMMTTELTWLNVLFVAILLFALYLGAREVVRSSRRAAAQRREANRLASISPSETVLHAVREESERLYTDIHGTLRIALDAIAEATSEAGSLPHGDDRAVNHLREVQRHARSATTDLRRMLGLLRADDRRADGADGIARSVVSGGSRSSVPSWPPARGWIIVAVVVLAEFFYVSVFWEEGVLHTEGQTPLRAVIQIVLTCAAALIFLAPATVTVASAATAAAFALGLVIDAPVVSDLWLIVPIGVLAGRTIARPSRQPWSALAFCAFVAIMLVSQWLAYPDALWLTVVLVALAVVVAAIVRVADAVHEAAGRRASTAEEAIAAETDAAVHRHRLEIGRDLHDALSGTIGVIFAQAGAAEVLWRTEPDRAAEALAVVAPSVEHALADLDQLSSLVALEERSARGLADVPVLVARLRAAGLDVTFSPDLPAVDGDTAAAAYRIIQECLSNAALHAPGSRVEVSARIAEGRLHIVVADDGPGAVAEEGGGYGLVGLRERASQLGGSLAVESDAPGFRVTASLPVIVTVSP